MKRKVLISTSSFEQLEVLSAFEVILNPLSRRLTEKEIADLLSTYNPDALIAGVEPITEYVLSCSDSLKVISRCGVGMDSVDSAAAGKRGISLINTPNAPAPSVAEMTVALMLSSLRNIPMMDRGMKSGKWEKKKGYLLGAKRIGLIGCGRIGTMTARLLQPFGAKLYGYDPFLKDHALCEMVSLKELLENSDIISLHLPLNEDTKGIIGRKAMELMKPGALLVNTSRGGILDENALYEALKANRISAALDVFCEEPYCGPLADPDLPVVLSPHQGSSAAETRVLMEKEAAEHVIEFFSGGGLIQ